jgi:hypothetical protein
MWLLLHYSKRIIMSWMALFINVSSIKCHNNLDRAMSPEENPGLLTAGAGVNTLDKTVVDIMVLRRDLLRLFSFYCVNAIASLLHIHSSKVWRLDNGPAFSRCSIRTLSPPLQWYKLMIAHFLAAWLCNTQILAASWNHLLAPITKHKQRWGSGVGVAQSL